MTLKVGCIVLSWFMLPNLSDVKPIFSRVDFVGPCDRMTGISLAESGKNMSVVTYFKLDVLGY